MKLKKKKPNKPFNNLDMTSLSTTTKNKLLCNNQINQIKIDF